MTETAAVPLARARSTPSLIAAKLGGCQGQHRAHALATCSDKVACQLRDQRNFAVHVVDDDLIDALHVGIDKAYQGVKAGFGRLLRCDIGHAVIRNNFSRIDPAHRDG